MLQEFFVKVKRKLSRPLAHDQAQRALRDLAKLPIVLVDAEMILKAIETARAVNFRFGTA